MSATIVDIARKVGVTPTTVSKVLNRAKSETRISDATRRKVLAAARDLNYRPSLYARALRKGRTFTLGFLCGDIEAPYFSELTSLAMMRAESLGYHLLVSLTQWDYKKELASMEALLQRGVDGAIACSEAFAPGVPLVEEMRERNFPLVTLTSGDIAFPSITSDWREGMKQAAHHLRRKGHTRVGYVGCKTHLDDHPIEKYPSLLRACEEEKILLERYEISLRADEVRRFGAELAKRPGRPDAFVVYSDYLAMSFLAGLQDAGLRIPQDADVIGIDGTAGGERMYPALTSVGQNLQEMITRAIDLVLEMLDGNTVPAEIQYFPTKLIVRQSS